MQALPRRFFELSERDCRRADLVIVMGTSLKVFPFAGIKDEVCERARLGINMAVGPTPCMVAS